jgi:hypothetical protein
LRKGLHLLWQRLINEGLKYRIYIDETGNPDLQASDKPNHRFLSLTGIIVELQYSGEVLHPAMEQLKAKYFAHHPDEPVVFHRKEMLGGSGPFVPLKDPVVRERFNADLLQLFSQWQYAVVTVCIDKQKHLETYQSWRYDPYHYCLEVLLERYIFFLEGVGKAVGDVMAESRGGKEDMRLKKVFTELWKNGNSFIEPKRFQERLTSKQLKIRPKTANVSGLQLADLIAHPSRTEILMECGKLETAVPPFGLQIMEILKAKYYQRGSRIFGKKML